MSRDPHPVTLAQALQAMARDLQQEPVPQFERHRPQAVDDAAPRLVHPGADAARTRRALSWRMGLVLATLVVWIGAAAWLAAGADPRQRASSPVRMARADSAFVPVVPMERIHAVGGEAEPAWVVDAEWPAERLASLGLPFDPARADRAVRAELLLHRSGEVLAVRVLYEPTTGGER